MQVVCADHACLLVPLQLEASLWRLVPGEETLLTHPLHWMVRRLNLEYFPRGRSYWDRWSHADFRAENSLVLFSKSLSLSLSVRYLVGGYLSSQALVNWFSKAVMETVNWPTISSTMDCLVRPVLGGSDLRLEIRYVIGRKVRFPEK